MDGIESSNPQGGAIPQWLVEFMANQRAVNESLQQSNQQLALQLKALASNAAKGVSTGTSTASTPSVTPAPQITIPIAAKPKHSRRHPDPYTHEDESMYPQFRGGLEAKLRIDGPAIGGEEEKVWYAIDCLKDKAARRIYPWVEAAKDTNRFTVCELLSQMDLAFADPQKEAKAVALINKIKQGGRPFREFLQDFEQTLLEAKGWAWADAIKKGLLKAALSGELTDRLIGKEEPADYASYCAVIRRVADDLQAWKDTRRFKSRPVIHLPQSNPALAESMEWEPTRTTTVSTMRAQQPAQRARWVSDAVRKQRWESGACLRCGIQGHTQGNCSLRPAKPPGKTEESRKGPQKKTSVASMAAKKKPVVEEVFTDDSEEGDLGKE
jgi:hypothetical protein